MKNHEVYTDLTAYKAIKNISKTRRKATGAKLSGLTYKIGELQSFGKAIHDTNLILKYMNDM